MEQLTPQQAAFVNEYFLNGLNLTKAYETAYNCTYESANASASRLLVKVSIQDAIQKKFSELQQRNNISIDDILNRLQQIIKDCEKDNDKKTELKAWEQVSKILGAYAPKKIEQVGATPLVVNIIKP